MNDLKYNLHARSKRNGIVFYSKTLDGLGLEAYYDENGEIKTSKILTSANDFDTFLEMLYCENKISDKLIFGLNILMFLIGLVLFLTLNNYGIFVSAITFTTFSDRIFNFINFSISIKSKNSEDYSLGKFHSAEHMACHAYEKLKRIPTLDEAKKYSRFHKRCGSKRTISNFFFMIALIFVFPFLFLSPKYLVLLAIIAIIFYANNKFNILSFLQIMVTNKATEKELLLAIEGLKEFEIMEDLARENPDKIIFDNLHSFYKTFKIHTADPPYLKKK